DIPPSLKRDAALAKPPVRTAAATKTKKSPAKTKKPAKTPAPKTPTKVPNLVTLKELCAELKIDPYDARVTLRAAVADTKIKHATGQPWEWPKGSDALAATHTAQLGRAFVLAFSSGPGKIIASGNRLNHCEIVKQPLVSADGGKSGFLLRRHRDQ